MPAFLISLIWFSDLAWRVLSSLTIIGIELNLINKPYPSSKTCSNCGTLKEDLSLKDGVFDCHSCGLSLDRDLNASINIHRIRAQL
ncbi:zinc ribbon domain-containing protein [Helicobacter suis]|uniref:zinc ribbon domain-containing protein n=1 Tax=Helicobacter suis TaxID=104628 RepID=UPI003D313798